MQVERVDANGIPAGWKAAIRVDFGKLRKVERTPSGGARVPAAIAREGVLVYQRADGSIQRELVPPDEVSSLDSLNTLRDAVVTVGHPDGGTRMVSPSTYKTDSVGHVSGEPRVEQGHLMTDLAILDADALRRVDAGELVEISSGYLTLIDPTPGEFRGERYDVVQRRRKYNHVALLPSGGGRAGASVSLRLDGQDLEVAFQIRAQEHAPAAPVLRSDSMTATIERETIDQIPLIVGSPEWRQAISLRQTRRDEEYAKLEEGKKKADADLAALTAERDALKAKLAEVEAKLADATGEEKADARIAARLELVEGARRVLGPDEQGKPRAFKRADGKSMSDKEIKLAVLAKLAPDLGDASKLSDVMIAAHYDARIKLAAERPSDALTSSRSDAFAPPTSSGPPSSPHTVGRSAPVSLESRFKRPA